MGIRNSLAAMQTLEETDAGIPYQCKFSAVQLRERKVAQDVLDVLAKRDCREMHLP